MKFQCDSLKVFFNIVVVTIFCLFCNSALAFNNDVRNTANRMHRNTETLIKSLQGYLQANGRWSPKPGSADMQACNLMHEVEKQAKDLKNRGANMNQTQLASATNRLQSSIHSLGRQLKRINANQIVLGNYRNVRNDSRQLSSISSASFGGAFSNPGFVNNPYTNPAFGTNPYVNPAAGNYNQIGHPTFGKNNPYTPNFNPGAGNPYPYNNPANFNPNNIPLDKNAIRSTTSQLAANVDQLVKGLQAFLTAKGRWMPPAGSKDMLACQAMHELQKQSQKLKNRAYNMNYNDLASSTSQLRQQARGLKDQLRRIGADGTVMNQMDLVSNDVRQLRSFTNGGYPGPNRWQHHRFGRYGNSRGNF